MATVNASLCAMVMIALSMSAQAQQVHQVNISAKNPLQIPGVRWGSKKEQTTGIFRAYGDSQYGLPYYNLGGLEFHVQAGFDEVSEERDSDFKETGTAWKYRVPTGLNSLYFRANKYCPNAEYAQLKKMFLDRLEVAEPEQTSAVIHSMKFLLPGDNGTVDVLSICADKDHSVDGLALSFSPGVSKVPATCDRIHTGEKWVRRTGEIAGHTEDTAAYKSSAKAHASKAYDWEAPKQCREAFNGPSIRNVRAGGRFEAKQFTCGVWEERGLYKGTCDMLIPCSYEELVEVTGFRCHP